MTELQNRTLICSVLFLDIVEYSRQPVTEQIALKDRLNALLSEALRGVAINDRIILDTGDGAAVSFIGDPEDALFVASSLRDSIASEPEPALVARMGINLGPVRLVKDINGRPNVIGDGINVAQRVMTFAQPGQVLVSRSYYEVVSRLSDESSKLFSYEGSRTDKHVREHEVYAVGATPPTRRHEDDQPDWRKSGDVAASASLARASGAVQRMAGYPPLATALAVAAILALAFVIRAWREEPVAAHSTAILVPPPQAKAPASTTRPLATPQQLEPTRRGEPPSVSPPVDPKARSARAEPESASASPRDARVAQKAVSSARESAEPAPAATAAPAKVTFAVAPWGEIHIDGKMHGVSPPLQELELPPGKHRIEVRNSGARPHVVEVEAKPGERIRIKHKFN
ncbi:MAG: adenylate/guanylate cyclase domain-containing protein [Burkholderiales bacterium]